MRKNFFKLSSLLTFSTVLFLVSCSDDDNPNHNNPEPTQSRWITVAGAVMGTTDPTSWRRKWWNDHLFNYQRRC